MDYLASLDSSRDLQLICAKNFINRLHLVLQINKIPTQKILRGELSNFAFFFSLSAGDRRWEDICRQSVRMKSSTSTCSLSDEQHSLKICKCSLYCMQGESGMNSTVDISKDTHRIRVIPAAVLLRAPVLRGNSCPYT